MRIRYEQLVYTASKDTIMNKRLIFATLILSSIGTSNAMYMSLPDEDYLKRALCNAGYRAMVEQTDLVKNLAGKSYSPADVHAMVKIANVQLAKEQTKISAETLENHLPVVTAVILKDFHTALDELVVLNILNTFALEKLARIGVNKTRVQELRQRVLHAQS